MTFTVKANGIIAVVTAENVAMAKLWLESDTKLRFKSTDFIPIVTTNRWVRILHKELET